MRLYGMARTVLEASESGEISDITLRNVDIHVIPGADGTVEKQLDKRGAYMLTVKNVRDAVLDGVRVFADDGIMNEWEGAFCCEGCEDIVIRNCQLADER
jgi:hypothetical protein